VTLATVLFLEFIQAMALFCKFLKSGDYGIYPKIEVNFVQCFFINGLSQFLWGLWVDPSYLQVVGRVEILYFSPDFPKIYRIKPLINERNCQPGILWVVSLLVRIIVMQFVPLSTSKLFHGCMEGSGSENSLKLLFNIGEFC
jgi:hypothetical protein